MPRSVFMRRFRINLGQCDLSQSVWQTVRAPRYTVAVNEHYTLRLISTNTVIMKYKRLKTFPNLIVFFSIWLGQCRAPVHHKMVETIRELWTLRHSYGYKSPPVWCRTPVNLLTSPPPLLHTRVEWFWGEKNATLSMLCQIVVGTQFQNCMSKCYLFICRRALENVD